MGLTRAKSIMYVAAVGLRCPMSMCLYYLRYLPTLLSGRRCQRAPEVVARLQYSSGATWHHLTGASHRHQSRSPARNYLKVVASRNERALSRRVKYYLP